MCQLMMMNLTYVNRSLGTFELSRRGRTSKILQCQYPSLSYHEVFVLSIYTKTEDSDPETMLRILGSMASKDANPGAILELFVDDNCRNCVLQALLGLYMFRLVEITSDLTTEDNKVEGWHHWAGRAVVIDKSCLVELTRFEGRKWLIYFDMRQDGEEYVISRLLQVPLDLVRELDEEYEGELTNVLSRRSSRPR
jgi:hypothetical protein